MFNRYGPGTGPLDIGGRGGGQDFAQSYFSLQPYLSEKLSYIIALFVAHGHYSIRAVIERHFFGIEHYQNEIVTYIPFCAVNSHQSSVIG